MTSTTRSFVRISAVVALGGALAIPAARRAALPARAVENVKPCPTSRNAAGDLGWHFVVPAPESVESAGEGAFELTRASRIRVASQDTRALEIGVYLAERLRPSTGFPLPVVAGDVTLPEEGSITLRTKQGDDSLGDEGYALRVTAREVTLSAQQAAGLFRGIQTLRQGFRGVIEGKSAQPGPWRLAVGTIRDRPRYAWRGVMLDVARHFFGLPDLMRFVDLMALYKMNVFHLHLTDDQGWRLEIRSRPLLAARGGNTQVGGGPGGYLTRQDFQALVDYAAKRYIRIVPEIDMPGHSTAALSSDARLTCDGRSVPPYTGIDVGLPGLCVDRPATLDFVRDVISEVATLSPAKDFHVGGDESAGLGTAAYERFMKTVQQVVREHGKRLVGWDEVGDIGLDADAVVQFWNHPSSARAAARRGMRIIMSPARHAYLDMKYDALTALGQDWAGFVPEPQAYAWDPATEIDGVGESSIAGVEGALWTETLRTKEDLDVMAFPRIIALAEVGWSRQQARIWEEFRCRLAAQGARLQSLGVRYHRSERVPWSP